MKINLFKKETGLVGIWQTVYTMKELVHKSIQDRNIKNFTVLLLKRKNISPEDLLGQTKAIFDYIRKNVRYVKDIFTMEEIQTPSRMIFELRKKGWAYGDCDDMALLSASMLYNIGIPTRFVVIATKPKTYNHIRTEALLQGKWIPLELASTKSFGERIESLEKPLILNI